MKNQKRLTYLLIVLFLVLAAVISFHYVFSNSKNIKEYVNSVVHNSVESQARAFTAEVIGERSTLDALASCLAIDRFTDSEDITVHLEAVYKSADKMDYISVVYPDKSAINNKGKTFTFSDNKLLNAVKKGKDFTGAVKGDGFSDTLHFVIAVPYFDNDGKFLAAVVASYFPERFKKIFEIGFFDSSISVICDDSGDILYCCADSLENVISGNMSDYFKAVKYVNSENRDYSVLFTADEGELLRFSKNNQKKYAASRQLSEGGWYIVDIYASKEVETSTSNIVKSGWYTIVGIIICVVCVAILFLYEYRKRMRIEAGHRADMLMSQINPHFMFNTLSAISSLIGYEPETASKMTYCFSKYMRANLNILLNDKNIPFKKELDHIKAFADIEYVRFRGQVKSEFNIDAIDFLISPLTVEMLVENAVNYGLRAKSGGGTVTVSTSEDENGYTVTVKDDGAGYNIGDIKKNPYGYRDIKNIEYRIKHMCHGTLTVNGVPGVGTTSVIHIPKSNALKGDRDENNSRR